MAATWNPILRYQAMQELDRRRKSELAYTTPLQKAPDMKEFLQHFYKQAYTSDKRQQYEQERIKYPQVDQIYEDLCLKEKIVSFEDFWQRYEYRCNFDRIVIELTQAASNDKNDNDDDSGFYDAVTSTVKKKKKKKTKQTAESSSSSNDHRPTSPDFASQLNNLWNSVTGIEPLSPSTNQNNSTTGTSPQNEIEPPTKFMNPAMAKLVDDKTVKDSTGSFSTPTANQMKEGKQQQVISPNDTPKASEPTPPREFATQVNSFWNSVISTSASSSSSPAPDADAAPKVPSSNTGDILAAPPSVNSKTTTKPSSIPSKTPDSTPMATPPITPTTEVSISKILDTAGSALISKLSPTTVDHHKLASSPESALINRKTVDASTIANEQLAQPVLLSKEEEEMKARTLLRIKAAEQAKALEDARKEVEKRKREQFEAKLQQQQEQQQAEAAKRKQQQEEKAAAAEEAKRARASKKSKKQHQRHPKEEHQFVESAPNDTDVINKDGDTAMDDFNIATSSANDSPNNKTIEEDENEDKWTNISYTDDEDSTDDDENKINENDVLQAAEARANAMKLLQDNSSNKEKNSEKTIQQPPKTELKEFGQHNISTSSSSQGGLSQADFLKEAVNKKKEGDPNMTTTPSSVVRTEMNSLPGNVESSATPKEEEIHTPPTAFSAPRGEFDKKKPHEEKTTIITNDTSTAQGEHLEDSLNNSSNGNNENEQQPRNATVTSDKPANNLVSPPPGTLAAALGISVLKMDPKNHPQASNIKQEGEKEPPIQLNNTNSSALANPACSETAAAPLQGTLAEALGLKIDQSPAASHIRQSGESPPPIQPYNKNSSALEYLAERGATTAQSSETLAEAISTSTHHTSTTESSTNSLDNKTERGLIYDTLRVVTVLAVLLSILVTHSPETIIDFIGI